MIINNMLIIKGYRVLGFVSKYEITISMSEATGFRPDDHFRGVTKMFEIGREGQRPAITACPTSAAPGAPTVRVVSGSMK